MRKIYCLLLHIMGKMKQECLRSSTRNGAVALQKKLSIVFRAPKITMPYASAIAFIRIPALQVFQMLSCLIRFRGIGMLTDQII